MNYWERAAFVALLCCSGAHGAGIDLSGGGNTASGNYSGVGGVGSVSQGVGGFVWGIGSRQLGGGSAFGRNLRADGTDTHVSGQGVHALRDNGGGNGWSNLSHGMQGWVTGHQSNDRGIQGARAYASGSFAQTGDEGIGKGDAQRIELILRTITTDALPKQLSSSAYNVAAGTSPNVVVLTVPDNGSLRVKGGAVARSSTGASKSWEFAALVKRGVGAASTVLVGADVFPEFGDAETSAWAFSVGADTANGSVALSGMGATGATIQWVAHVISIENVGGTQQSGGSGGAPPPPPGAEVGKGVPLTDGAGNTYIIDAWDLVRLNGVQTSDPYFAQKLRLVSGVVQAQRKDWEFTWAYWNTSINKWVKV